ncbi:unnamed protein product, partial [Symbiodinium pilosum]
MTMMQAEEYGVQVVLTDNTEAEFDQEMQQSYERSTAENYLPVPEDFGYALNFWKAYASSTRRLKAPAWREAEESRSPPPLPPRVRLPGQRSWAEEAAVQRKLALEQQSMGDPQ